ncbi:hypothetical protein SASPL_104602 [Salvia splendens]|uniref:Uncharacterized protein n=1 Tax=Salvia splendens TaxID=180675 RepID=A0A8X8YJQ9_SALSN|nr:hypothetical protein SASPL_104602 [Salvia splendens]
MPKAMRAQKRNVNRERQRTLPIPIQDDEDDFEAHSLSVYNYRIDALQGNKKKEEKSTPQRPADAFVSSIVFILGYTRYGERGIKFEARMV